MKRSLFSLLIAAGLLSAGAVSAASNVSISIGDPGFYGRIDIGDAPPPRLIYTQPVIIERTPDYLREEPIYLRVPVGYQSNWRRHCRAYNACGRRVYFVQDTWYRDQYIPHYRQHHGRPRGRDFHREPMHGGGPRGDWHGNGRPGDHGNDHHDNRPGNGPGRPGGPGNGHGNGHDNGHDGRGDGRGHGGDNRGGGNDGRGGNDRQH